MTPPRSYVDDVPSGRQTREQPFQCAASQCGDTTNSISRAGQPSLIDYISIARPDHWCKNAFMLVGTVLGCFYHPEFIAVGNIGRLIWAIAATCCIASSNYVLNEILDAPTDRAHPVKRHRPIPSGRVRLPIAYLEWIALGICGAAMAYMVNIPFFVSGLALLAMGIVYNVRPLRTKELPYLDVLSEAVNNPIRLALGWFVVSASAIPPVSLIVSYWMVGAFFMATKRFAEYRSIGDQVRAAAYRNSFHYYDESRLLVSMFFYATASALFLGVFIVRYHLELILSVPLIAGFFAVYLRMAFKPESAAQAPERLYAEKGLMAYLVVCMVVFLGLMLVKIPLLYELFNVEPARMPHLWEL